jgi:hypothetical protein
VIRVRIGVDTDTKKHGVSVYQGKKLVQLAMIETLNFDQFVYLHKDPEVDLLFIIEDVCANNFVYKRNQKASRAAENLVAICVGRNQQAQTELMRYLDRLEMNYRLIPPTRGNWAKNTKQFQLLTGWPKSGNIDTRSAAFFGYLGLNFNLK